MSGNGSGLLCHVRSEPWVKRAFAGTGGAECGGLGSKQLFVCLNGHGLWRAVISGKGEELYFVQDWNVDGRRIACGVGVCDSSGDYGCTRIKEAGQGTNLPGYDKKEAERYGKNYEDSGIMGR